MAESIACRGMVKIAGQNGEARKVGLIGCGKVQHSEEKRGHQISVQMGKKDVQTNGREEEMKKRTDLSYDLLFVGFCYSHF